MNLLKNTRFHSYWHRSKAEQKAETFLTLIQFFAKGTLLDQISQNLSSLSTYRETIRKSLEQKKEVLLCNILFE